VYVKELRGEPWDGRGQTIVFDLYHPMAHPDMCSISDPPLLCHPPSDWLRLFSNQTFFRINTPTFSTIVILHTYPPMKMEQTECSEMLAYKIQMPGNYPEESIQHSEHSESLKSRICMLLAKVSTINIGYSLHTITKYIQLNNVISKSYGL